MTHQPTATALRTLWANVALTALREYRNRVKYAAPGVTVVLSGDRLLLADRETEIARATEYLQSEDFAEVCANAGMTVRMPALLEYVTGAKPAVWNPDRQHQLSMDLTPCIGARTMGNGSHTEARI